MEAFSLGVLQMLPDSPLLSPNELFRINPSLPQNGSSA
jgi:hypothetical protein